jgi:hypothetical protein
MFLMIFLTYTWEYFYNIIRKTLTQGCRAYVSMETPKVGFQSKGVMHSVHKVIIYSSHLLIFLP